MVPQEVAGLLLSVFYLFQFPATLKHFRRSVYYTEFTNPDGHPPSVRASPGPEALIMFSETRASGRV